MFIYVVGDSDGLQKVGVARLPVIRLGQLQSEAHPRRLTLVHSEPASYRRQAMAIERFAHNQLADHSVGGEWFRVAADVAIKAVRDGVSAILGDERPPTVARETIQIMLTASQIKAARALIDWTQADLAEASGLSIMSIKNIERGVTDPKASTMVKLQSALEAGGVIFLDPGVNRDGGSGLRLKL